MDAMGTKLLSQRSARGRDHNWAITVRDARDVMAAMPPGCIDVVIADPPYFLSRGGSTNRGGKRVAVDKGAWDRPRSPQEQDLFHRQWIAGCRRVLARHGTLWVSGTHHVIFAVGHELQQSGWDILNCVTWRKPSPAPNLGRRSLTHAAEFIIWARPSADARHVFNYAEARAANDGKQLQDVWTIGRPTADEKRYGQHSTQKPLALMRRIIDVATRPGAIVFEPFMGSATAGVAALASGRRYVGVDLDPESYELALQRLTGAS